MPKSGTRHYSVCAHAKIGDELVPHVDAMERIYKAFDCHRTAGVRDMAHRVTLSLTTSDGQSIELNTMVHGLEPELPIDIDQVENFLPDPRFPDWETQLNYHKRINDASRRARGCFWGTEHLSLILYFLKMSDDCGSHLERTGRKF